MYIKHRWVNHILYENCIDIDEKFIEEMNKCFHEETSAPMDFMITEDHIRAVFNDHFLLGMITDRDNHDIEYDIGDWITDYIGDNLCYKETNIIDSDVDDIEIDVITD